MTLMRNEKGRFYGNHATASAAIYFPWVLQYVYDLVVYGFFCRFVWCCPQRTVLQPLLGKHTKNLSGLKICDIGVGTGYHLAHADLGADSQVTLVDLNQECLKTTRDRLATRHPKVKCDLVERNVLDDLQELPGSSYRSRLRKSDWHNAPYDVVSSMFLLHCLPGPVSRKAKLLEAWSNLVKEDGVLIGCTILGKGVRHNFLGRSILWWTNNWGILGNENDDARSFVAQLEESFGVVLWKVTGRVLVFEASQPLRRGDDS